MAGCESDAGNPLVIDFIVIGRKLEKLGFVYSKNKSLSLGKKRLK